MIVTNAFVAFNAMAASILTPTPAKDVTVTFPDPLVALALPAVLLPVILSEVQVPLKLAPVSELLIAVASLALVLVAVLLPAVLVPTIVSVPAVCAAVEVMSTPKLALLLAVLVLPVLLALLAPAVLVPLIFRAPDELIFPNKLIPMPAVLEAILARAPALEVASAEVLEPVMSSVPPV